MYKVKRRRESGVMTEKIEKGEDEEMNKEFSGRKWTCGRVSGIRRMNKKAVVAVT